MLEFLLFFAMMWTIAAIFLIVIWKGEDDG